MTPATPLPSTWENAAPLLRPRLRSDAWLDRRALLARRRGLADDGCHRRLGGSAAIDLHLTVVIDDEKTMTTVTDRMVRRWGVSFERACRRALANLARRSRGAWLPVAPGLWLAPWEDGYASSRLICAPPPLDDAIAALPDRDVLLLADPRRPEALEALAHALEDLACPNPLTAQLCRVRRRDDGQILAPYRPPRRSPAAVPLDNRRATERLGRYRAQRGALQALVDDDLHVARAQAIREPDGRLRSYALWSQGTPTLLPEVDRVHLLETGAPGAGHRLWATDFDALVSLPGVVTRRPLPLARWRTHRFPSAADLRRIATPLERDPIVELGRAS